jgi:uncharacterized protein YggE
MRRLLFALLASLPTAALAQTPASVPAPTSGNIAVEAVEVIRQKPDTVKLYMKVEARNAEAAVASDEATDEAKKMTDGLAKLKLTGVAVAALPQRTVRSEVLNRNVPGGGQGQVEYRVVKPITVTVTDADHDKFTAAVEKVQMEAFKLGLMPDLASDNLSYNSSTGQQERNSPFRAVYSRKGGWDELTGPALERATKKARAKAEALAAGSGVTLGAVSSLNEVMGYTNPGGYNPYGAIATAGDPEDALADGELVRQIRVRVVFATK